MKNNLEYVWEQLMLSVMSLVSSENSARERLINAVLSRTHRIFLDKNAIKSYPEIFNLVESLENTLTENGTKPYKESIDQMDEMTVTNTAEQIVELFSKVCRNYPEIN